MTKTSNGYKFSCSKFKFEKGNHLFNPWKDDITGKTSILHFASKVEKKKKRERNVTPYNKFVFDNVLVACE